MTMLVTGANGFVGSALCARLRGDGVSVRGAVRSQNLQPSRDDGVAIGGLSSETAWTASLRNVDQVVHLAVETRRAGFDVAVATRFSSHRRAIEDAGLPRCRPARG